MTVDQIRPKAENRQGGKACLTEIRVFLNLKQRIVRIGFYTCKIPLIIYKIIFHAVYFGFQNSHILILPVEIHIKMRPVTQFFFHLI